MITRAFKHSPGRDQDRTSQHIGDRSAPIAASTAQAEMSRPSAIQRSLRASLLLVPIALWIWLCRGWPARLGFYSDDWMLLLHPFVGTAEAYRDIARVVASRPVSIPFIWLAQVLVDWSPVRSQVLNALMLLMTAACVGLLASALVSASRLRDGALAAACATAASFIVFPPNLGTFAWGVGVTTAVPALPLFCVAMYLLLNSRGRWWRIGAGLLLSLLSHLAYEAFYFQEIPLILIAIALRGGSNKDIPWRVLIGIIIVNVLCVAFNRLNPGGVHKTFTLNFLRVFDAGFSHFFAILGHAVREHKILVGFSVLGAMVSGSICLTGIIEPAKAGVALFLVICGVVASGFLYAFAGYPLHAEGPPARVFIVIATYYSLAAGVLSAAAWCAFSKRRALAMAFCCCSLIGLAALDMTARLRVSEWADAWTYEVARLARLPPPVATLESKHRVYVAVEEKAGSTIEPATAPWEITGAVAWASYKLTNSRLLALDLWRGVPAWFATPPDWFNRWDGTSFAQGPCKEAASVVVPATELWLWRTSTSKLTQAEAPWQFGCQ